MIKCHGMEANSHAHRCPPRAVAEWTKLAGKRPEWARQDHPTNHAVEGTRTGAEGGCGCRASGEEEWRCKESSIASSQLPHRGVVATRRLREGPSPEDSERSARNARAAVCEVAKEQQARQQQGGHWNGFIHHITVHIGGRVNR